MKFLKSAVLLGLVTGVFAAPVPQDSSSDIANRLAELENAVYGISNEKRVAELDFSSILNHLEARAQIKDTKCPDNGKTYTKDQIAQAVKSENDKANPDQYGNREGGKQLFNTNEQLYKARLDSKLPSIK
jgi:hypothetical protein